MKSFTTQGIILARTNYGEADRIITFLTPDHGKIKGFARAVRKPKSKLAGGLELFSVSELSFMAGKSEINTILSTRLSKHYGSIVKDLDRSNLAYELIKRINKATEDSPEPAYFHLLNEALIALDDINIDLALIQLWFNMQLLRLAGHTPDLRTDTKGQELLPKASYTFDFDQMHFSTEGEGVFKADHIKFLRLGFGPHTAKALNRIKDCQQLAKKLQPLVQTMLQNHVRIA
jgi:DNA repair protein RecO (recombination protein O)